MAPRENKDPTQKTKTPSIMEILKVTLLSRQKQKVNQDLTNMSPTYPPDNYRITQTNEQPCASHNIILNGILLDNLSNSSHTSTGKAGRDELEA